MREDEFSSAPSVYIILLNWNGWLDTKECLESLRACSYVNFAIVLVDNGSADECVATVKAEYSDVHLIEMQTNTGFAEGNNIGIEFALKHGADYILLLNNDTYVSPNFIEPLVTVLQSGANIVSSLIYYAEPANKIWFAGSRIDWRTGWAYHTPSNVDDEGQFTGIINADYLTGCSLGASSDTWKTVGPLDPRFFAYYEDADWSVRAKKLGYKTVVVTDSHVWHKVSQSSKLTHLGMLLFVRNGLLFIKKHVKSNRATVSARFIDQWVVRPIWRELKSGQFSRQFARARISGLIAHIRGRYGTPFAPKHEPTFVNAQRSHSAEAVAKVGPPP